jgi:hypothetical protein
MPFKEGDPKPENSGRKAGTANKRSRQIEAEADEAGVLPTRLLVMVLSGEKKEICGEPVTKDDWKWALSELLPYTAGKRKPVDSEGNDSRDPLSDLVDALNSRR